MKTILFDMDGTLTEPRKKMLTNVCNAMTTLQKSNYQIGIVSGSDIDYIIEQCALLTEINSFDHTGIDLYPCNGTKHYRYTGFDKLSKIYDNDFSAHVGSELFSKLVYTLFDLLSKLRDEEYSHHVPLTGNFIDYRGSMINFSPIGRNASEKERNTWISLDKKFGIRSKLLNSLRSEMTRSSIEFKLGGETSIDICPTGWDKTYVLKNFAENDNVSFVGDKCRENGNDRELYDAVKLRLAGESFETTGPYKTIEIINDRILQHSVEL